MLSLTAEYALRITAFLATQPADALTTAVAMGARVRVPANYRGKILHQLARAGVLVSVRGRSGGFRLARRADRIRLAEVVAPFEPPGTVRRCVLGRPRCSDAGACSAHASWRQVQRARDAFLQQTTVAALAG
jgi:Rrf2 family transcriptional regulator, nitric oxide-sensitive transcriptional repressor